MQFIFTSGFLIATLFGAFGLAAPAPEAQVIAAGPLPGLPLATFPGTSPGSNTATINQQITQIQSANSATLPTTWVGFNSNAVATYNAFVSQMQALYAMLYTNSDPAYQAAIYQQILAVQQAANAWFVAAAGTYSLYSAPGYGFGIAGVPGWSGAGSNNAAINQNIVQQSTAQSG